MNIDLLLVGKHCLHECRRVVHFIKFDEILPNVREFERNFAQGFEFFGVGLQHFVRHKKSIHQMGSSPIADKLFDTMQQLDSRGINVVRQVSVDAYYQFTYMYISILLFCIITCITYIYWSMHLASPK